MTTLTATESAAVASRPLRRSVTPWSWLASSGMITLLVAMPVIAVVYLALFPTENIWPHLLETTLPLYLQNTLLLMLGVGTLSLLIGVSTAWVVTLCEFPGRRWLEWALLLPFAVPAYVIAYVYTDLLDYAGAIQVELRALFSWTSARDYWFPEIRSLGGAILMMSLVLYPYIYLLARSAFLEQSPSLFAASRSLGHSAWATLWRVVLPVARPSIVVGLSLVLMETLNDFGTVDYFAVRTLTAGLFDTWNNLANVGGAAQIASLMLLFVVFLITAERHSRRRQKQYAARDYRQPLQRFRLKRSRQYGCLALCLTPVLLGFVVPAWVLADYAWRYFEVSWTPDFVRHTLSSLSLSATAACITLLIGVVLAYSRRLHDTGIMRLLVRLSSLGYAMPGAVLAVGIIVPLAAVDNQLVDWLARVGIDSGLLLLGTPAALVFAYVVRFLAVSAGGIESGLQKVTPSMDMASRSLGLGTLGTLVKVHVPILRTSLLTAALVVFVDCMKELPATLILRPFNYDTLATYVYQFASDEQLERSALSALVIVIAGMIPVILLSRSISASREIQ